MYYILTINYYLSYFSFYKMSLQNNHKIALEKLANAKLEKEYKVGGYQQLTECLKVSRVYLEDAKIESLKYYEEYTRIDCFEITHSNQITDPNDAFKSSLKMYKQRLYAYIIFIKSTQKVDRLQQMYDECVSNKNEALDEYKNALKRVAECENDVIEAETHSI